MSAETKLKTEREKLFGQLKDPLSGKEGTPFEHRHARLLDTFFQTRLQEIVDSLPAAKARKLTNGTALIAVGGYGRGELCPHSDIDILIICKGPVKPEAIDLAQPLFMPLWDMGCDLGHGFRSIKDCVSLAGQDYSVLVSFLDIRHIAGDDKVTELLRERMEKLFIKRYPKLIAWLEENRLERAQRFGDASAMLEPHLKEGMGGLRDSQTINWMDTLRQMLPRSKGGPLLTASERKDLKESTAFLLRARSRLHIISGRRNDTAYMELQPKIATLTGHVRDDVGEGVELFLAELHAAMTFIKNLISALARETARDDAKGRSRKDRSGKDDEVSPGIVSVGGELSFSSGRGDLEFTTLLDIFLQRARCGVPLSRTARQEVVNSLDSFAAALDDGSNMHKASGLFLDLLLSGNASDGLSDMQQSGVLGVFLPEFGRVQERVQFDDFHTYPVGRHTLETIRNLENLKALALKGKDEDPPETAMDRPFADMWLETFPHADTQGMGRDCLGLFLAALFHDLGKDTDHHETRGEKLAREILRRWNNPELTEEIAGETAFLVRQHLLLARTAVSRDLNDESVIMDMAGLCGSAARLRKLYLLTYADAKATGPRAWSDWTAHLLAELFDKTLNILEGKTLFQPHLAERSLRTRDRVRELGKNLDEGWLTGQRVEELLEVMPSRYTMERDPQEIMAHIRLVDRFERELDVERTRQVKGRSGHGFTLTEVRQKGQGVWEAVFVGKRTKGLFATIAGVLSLHGFDIFSGDSFLWKNGVMIAVFNVSDPPDPLFADELWIKVRGAVKYAMIGKLSLDERLMDKQKSLIKSGRFVIDPETVKVDVDNDITDFYTVIEVKASDRKGLLYDISHELNLLGVEIHQARVATHPDHIADMFYVLDDNGGKVFDPEHMESICQGVAHRLTQPAQRN